MIQKNEPIHTDKIQYAEGRIRSIHAPDTMDAAVHENNRNAAQKTPVIRSLRSVAMFGDHGVLAAPASQFIEPITGKCGKAQ